VTAGGAPRTFRFQRGAGGVATLTLDRPARLNALTFDTYRELHQTFVALQDDGDVRCVIITGAGAAFCSGGDLHEIVGPLVAMTPFQRLEFTHLTGQTVLAMRQLRKPIIAAVAGVAVGAGAVIALAADLRVVARTARFGFVFPRLGLAGADMGASWLLPRLVGLSRATELLMTGTLIDAATADRYGLCNRLVEPEQLMESATTLAVELAAGPPIAHAVTKDMLNREAHMDIAAAIEAEAHAQQLCMNTQDFSEGYLAAIEKRPPRFTGR
jgi:enoyl-CoA hydratase/carnithine racemase